MQRHSETPRQRAQRITANVMIVASIIGIVFAFAFRYFAGR